MKSVSLLTLLLCAAAWSSPLPPRQADAPGGREFARRILKLPLKEREAAVREQFLAGNVPESWRKFVELKICRKIRGRERTAILRVAPDYIAIGSDEDALLMPLTPATALGLAASLDCSIPTRRMVDEIHRAAPVKLTPAPLPAGPEMTTVKRFAEHHEAVRKQRLAWPPGLLTAGHKKDIVLTPRLNSTVGKVALYGWHRPDGTPVQPLYTGHSASWVDYSHGVRLAENSLTLDGAPSTIAAVLADAALAELLSDEGPVQPAGGDMPLWPAERVLRLDPEVGVQAVVNIPAQRNPARPLKLVIYAAPAGSTIDQTFGRKITSGEDPKFELQHLLAQTRWLRMHDPSADLAVAVVQCRENSWPAWRRARDPDNRLIPGIVDALRHSLQAPIAELTMSGHSAGGSFVFGYIDAVASIPPDISRLCFLDSNYAYSPDKGHHQKLAAWLPGDGRRRLCVLAYHDSAALLNGKPFVSEKGGTWGRSHAMLSDLPFPFTSTTADGVQRHVDAGLQVQFLLMENPERKILHTRLVEWNGFIHAQLFGTTLEQLDYRFPGPAVYRHLISSTSDPSR